METGIRVFLLMPVLAALAGCSSLRAWLDRDEAPPPPAEQRQAAAESSPDDDSDAAPPRVIDPEVERRRIKVPKIDTENFEVGAFFGGLSIEDFGTNPVYGITAAYHVTEDFFVKADIGRSTAGDTSFETLGGDIQLLTGDERRLTYYNLGLGYNFLPGEVFLGRGVAMNSTFFLTAGIGSTDFAGDQHFTLSFGGGYKVLPTDWLAVHVGVEDHLFESDLLGSTKLTNNLGVHVGATVFF